MEEECQHIWVLIISSLVTGVCYVHCQQGLLCGGVVKILFDKTWREKMTNGIRYSWIFFKWLKHQCNVHANRVIVLLQAVLNGFSWLIGHRFGSARCHRSSLNIWRHISRLVNNARDWPPVAMYLHLWPTFIHIEIRMSNSDEAQFLHQHYMQVHTQAIGLLV